MTTKERLLEFIAATGLSVAAFERRCGLSNGYVKNIGLNLGSNRLDRILNTFPQLSRNWLLYGEGQMLTTPDRVSVSATNTGVNTGVVGVGSSSNLSKALDEIAEQRKLVSKAQEQIDRLIDIIEKKVI